MRLFTKLTYTLLLASLSISVFGMEYSSYLKKYPLSTPSKFECEVSDIEYWRSTSQKLISTNRLKKRSRTFLNKKLEDHIQKNALINLAYARIAKKDSHKELYPLWIFIATNSSHIVGSSLKLNYKYLNKLPLNSDEQFDFVVRSVFKQRAFGNQVAKGNQAVFDDIYWKFLSADLCGAKTTVRLLNQNRIRYYKEILIWDHFLSSPGTLLEKSKRLAVDYVDIEQKLLQDVMYSTLSARITNAFRIFNRFAELKLIMPNAPSFLSYNDYSLENSDVSNNLADFESRISWMKYLIRTISPYANGLYVSNQSRDAFKELESLNLSTLK